MRRPRLLDLMCGAGGCARGYMDAGFYVIGVDIQPQPRYSGDEFYQADALTFPLDGFDAYHASPPCQHYTQMLNWNGPDRSSYPDLVAVVRGLLQSTGKPYIIENVPGAPVEKSIMLCGAMFGLRVYRHRFFESNMFLFQPQHPKHLVPAAHSGKIARPDQFWCPVGNFGQKDDAQRAMGIDWMKTTGSKNREIAQAVPPAYTEFIGWQLLAYIELAKTA